MFTTPEVEFNWRKYSKLRTALFPYIFNAAHQARANGLPITRHHILSFPSDQVAITQRYQYLFGDSLLVRANSLANSSIQHDGSETGCAGGESRRHAAVGLSATWRQLVRSHQLLVI